MNKKWLFDTDVLIDYLRGSQKASTFLTKVIDDAASSVTLFFFKQIQLKYNHLSPPIPSQISRH